MLVLAGSSGSGIKQIWHYLFWRYSAFCRLTVRINVWRSDSSRSHDSPESPTLPECSHLNHFIYIRQRSSFLSDKRAEYIWNPGKGAVSTWFRHYPSCQAKTMTKQCRISEFWHSSRNHGSWVISKTQQQNHLLWYSAVLDVRPWIFVMRQTQDSASSKYLLWSFWKNRDLVWQWLASNCLISQYLQLKVRGL